MADSFALSPPRRGAQSSLLSVCLAFGHACLSLKPFPARSRTALSQTHYGTHYWPLSLLHSPSPPSFPPARRSHSQPIQMSARARSPHPGREIAPCGWIPYPFARRQIEWPSMQKEGEEKKKRKKRRPGAGVHGARPVRLMYMVSPAETPATTCRT